MTRQRFEGLRLELCRRLHESQNTKFSGEMQRAVNNCHPKFEVVKSYANAWEMLKPARDCVGM